MWYLIPLPYTPPIQQVLTTASSLHLSLGFTFKSDKGREKIPAATAAKLSVEMFHARDET
jgi:hypothetical protein